MDNQKKSDPNEFKVVEFFNNTDFDFTPELGAMFDGRPLLVESGKRKQFPWYVGQRMAINLAKAVMVKGAPLHDPTANNPVGTPLWGEEKIKSLASSFITELYQDERPIAMTETDRLMQRVAELEKLYQKKEADKPLDAPREVVKSVQELVAPETIKPAAPVKFTYQDKAEVIAELEKKGIKFDRRQNKENLMKLLTNTPSA